jgi:hypothetical protein
MALSGTENLLTGQCFSNHPGMDVVGIWHRMDTGNLFSIRIERAEHIK